MSQVNTNLLIQLLSRETIQMQQPEKENQLLIVDDNPQVLSMLADILSDRYGIYQANSGVKGLGNSGKQ